MKPMHLKVAGTLFAALMTVLFIIAPFVPAQGEGMLSLNSSSSSFSPESEIKREESGLSSQNNSFFDKQEDPSSQTASKDENTSSDKGENAFEGTSSVGAQANKPGQTSSSSKPEGLGDVSSSPGASSSAASSQKPQGSNGQKPQSSQPSASTPSVPQTPAPLPTPAGKAVVGYYTGWSAYKGYTPLSVPAGKLTHLNYAFAKIDPAANSIALADPANDQRNFESLRRLKGMYPRLKTLISVGGWDYSTYFSDIASTAARREAFAQSCVDFILEHGFDGVDLDWEYPVSGGLAGNTNRPQDKSNFTLLLKAVRQKLDAQEKRDGRDYYLTIAGAANTSYLSKIEPAGVAGVVDYIFVMAYDMHGPWDQYSDFGAPLYRPQESSPQYKNSVQEAVSAYRNAGVPANKMVLGMPFYGYIYQGVSSRENGVYSTFSSAKSISYDSIRASYLNHSAYQKFRHQQAQVPYLYGNNTFISYEDSDSISAKAKFAKTMGLAGVGAWELSHDTSGVLLTSAYQALY